MHVWLLLAALLAALAACGPSTPAQPPETPPANTAEPAEPAAPTEPAEPAEPSKEQVMKEALARVDVIQDELAALRGLEFKKEVPAEFQSKEDFRAFVRAELERELPPEKAESLAAAAHHLGLVKEELDLTQMLEDTFVTQAGAYYDPRQAKFFMVMMSVDGLMLDVITAHELEHALQDQHFDLRAYYGEELEGDAKLSEDESNARRFVVEGEATFLMTAYAIKRQGTDPFSKQGMMGLRMGVSIPAKMSLDQLMAMQKQQAASMDPELKKAAEALDEIPPYIIVPLIESYVKGALPSLVAYEAGGWDRVNELFTDPPQSTEQVLHPKKKLIDKRDYPVEMTLAVPPLLKDWEEVHSDVQGELLWRVFLDQWQPEDEEVEEPEDAEKKDAEKQTKKKAPEAQQTADASEAAAGWDGDRWAVYQKDDAMVGLIATTWDTAKDAKELESAYIATITQRFPEATPKKRGAITTAERPDGTIIAVQRRGKDVFIVDGAPKGKARAFLGKLARSKKTRHEKDK